MRLIGWLLSGAAAAGMAGVARPGGQAANHANGLCRRAPALAALPAEVERPRTNPNIERGAVAIDSPVPMTATDAPPPPPPPPAPPAAMVDRSPADMVVTGSRRAEAAPPPPGIVAPPTTPAPRGSAFAPREPGQATPPAGLLTAGEHDDLLNPELYARYVADFLKGEPLAGVPRVDTARVLTVAVKDSRGQPVPFAPVTLTCADGNKLTLATLADGQATFFPDLDRLGQEVTIGVSGALPRRAVISPTPGAMVQSVTLPQPGGAVRAFDMALVVDTTGSMGDELNYLKSELRAIVAATRARHPGLDLRVALIFYRDRGDEYLTRTMPFTADIDRVQGDLARQNADGGGDEPESMEVAMIRAATLPWRGNAVKSLFLVADAPPHADDLATAWAAVEALRMSRVQIDPVAASDTNRGAEYIMRAMAAASQGSYLFLTDDSGIGNPHAPPAIDCYRVTKLADAMRRVIDSQLSGRRIEAAPEAVIRTVGTYDNGRCVLPPDWQRQQ